MLITVEFNNQSRSPIKKKFIFQAVKKTFEKVDFLFLAEKHVSLSVASVDAEEIKKINKEYRKKNQVTDVLSFAETTSRKELENFLGKELFLGEIILCYNDIAGYSKQNKISPEFELAKVLSHGVLHLLRFRHGTRMFSLQEAVARECVKQKK